MLDSFLVASVGSIGSLIDNHRKGMGRRWPAIGWCWWRPCDVAAIHRLLGAIEAFWSDIGASASGLLARTCYSWPSSFGMLNRWQKHRRCSRRLHVPKEAQRRRTTTVTKRKRRTSWHKLLQVLYLCTTRDTDEARRQPTVSCFICSGHLPRQYVNETTSSTSDKPTQSPSLPPAKIKRWEQNTPKQITSVRWNRALFLGPLTVAPIPMEFISIEWSQEEKRRRRRKRRRKKQRYEIIRTTAVFQIWRLLFSFSLASFFFLCASPLLVSFSPPPPPPPPPSFIYPLVLFDFVWLLCWMAARGPWFRVVVRHQKQRFCDRVLAETSTLN